MPMDGMQHKSPPSVCRLLPAALMSKYLCNIEAFCFQFVFSNGQIQNILVNNGFIDPYLAGNRTAPTSASKTTGLCLGTRWTSRYQGEKFVAGRFAVAEGAQHGAG